MSPGFRARLLLAGNRETRADRFLGARQERDQAISAIAPHRGDSGSGWLRIESKGRRAWSETAERIRLGRPSSIEAGYSMLEPSGWYLYLLPSQKMTEVA